MTLKHNKGSKMKLFNLISILLLTAHFANASAAPLNGAGSTFAEPLYTKWFSVYQQTDKTSQFNYQGIGSGAGIKQLIAGTVDFAGSDDPMKDEDAAKLKAHVLHIPIAIGAVVVSYNLTLDKPLMLSGTVVAKIFNGTIKKWNDPEIIKLNPTAKLPALDISVATRADGSGTTAVFSEYLSKISPEWAGKNGKTVDWFKGSIAAKGNAGVAGLIKQTPGTIGYVELVYAVENKLAYASIQNKAGKFIEANSASVSAAAANVKAEALAKEFKISITNSADAKAYPISSFTWLLLVEKMPKDKGTALVQFARWSMATDAQKIASQINYSPVPEDIRKEVLKKLADVKFE